MSLDSTCERGRGFFQPFQFLALLSGAVSCQSCSSAKDYNWNDPPNDEVSEIILHSVSYSPKIE
jgi:hypothetical protein